MRCGNAVKYQPFKCCIKIVVLIKPKEGAVNENFMNHNILEVTALIDLKRNIRIHTV